jgi:hypothetical protein
MSASREKKQRQGSGPSGKAARVSQEQAAYKRKARTYTAIGIVVVVLVAALLIWNSGFFQARATAATVNDTNYTVNDICYLYANTRYNNYYFYYAYGMSSYIPDDDDVADSETGETYRDQLMASTLEYATNLTAQYDAAVAAGYTASDVSDTVQEQLDTYKSYASSSGYSYSAYLKAQFGRYMTPSALKSILTRVAVASLYTSDYQDSLTYTDEQLEAYYQENSDSLDTFEYSYLYFTPETVDETDADGNELSDDEV